MRRVLQRELNFCELNSVIHVIIHHYSYLADHRQLCLEDCYQEKKLLAALTHSYVTNT